MRQSTDVNNEIIRKNYMVIAADSARPFFPPVKKQAVPFIDFSQLENALVNLERAAEHANDLSKSINLTPKQKEELNQHLYRAEQELLLEQGLPLRPWYRHVIYAPGFYTGYAVKTMPGIRESIEQRDYHQSEIEITRAAYLINKLAEYLSAL
jgi:N-acetylated-alpha-linked acidic dipeptidase